MTTDDDAGRQREGAVRDECPGCGHDTSDHLAEAGGCLSAEGWRDTADILCACPLSFGAVAASGPGGGVEGG